MWNAVIEVHLSLKQTDSIIELCGHAEGLIRCSIAFYDEWGVVRRNFGNISIFPVAKFGIVVASS